MNFAITGVLAVFVIVPEVFGADLEGTGARKKMLPVEEHYAYNLKVMWDFEGILRYSPIFYGYYSEKEKGAYLTYVRDLWEKELMFLKAFNRPPHQTCMHSTPLRFHCLSKIFWSSKEKRERKYFDR